MIEYKKARSKFWLKIFNDDVAYTNISTNGMVKGLLQEISPQLISCSPKGWKASTHLMDNYNLWIPNDRMDWKSLEYIESWAKKANQHIWLGTNKNTAAYFMGNEVDYCLAADWNIDLESQQRTIIGEAEYQLKYNFPKGIVSRENTHRFASVLSDAVLDCIDCLPINLEDFIIVSMPAIKEKKNKLAWQLADHIAKKIDRPFIQVTLTRDKPQIKEQTIMDKVRIWREIFSDGTMLDFSNDIDGASILIIDDLYQSGASIWCFAEYLKSIWGVDRVIAITPVKALKDGGNK